MGMASWQPVDIGKVKTGDGETKGIICGWTFFVAPCPSFRHKLF
jgi:hypothetical protein